VLSLKHSSAPGWGHCTDCSGRCDYIHVLINVFRYVNFGQVSRVHCFELPESLMLKVRHLVIRFVVNPHADLQSSESRQQLMLGVNTFYKLINNSRSLLLSLCAVLTASTEYAENSDSSQSDSSQSRKYILLLLVLSVHMGNTCHTLATQQACPKQALLH